MSEDKKKLEVVFAPGCFDEFDGTQEELDELMKQIMAMAESGELEANATPVDIGNYEFDDDDEYDDLNINNINSGRNIH